MSTVPFPKPISERPPVVSRRAMLTVSAAAGLSGLCAGYVTLTRPLLRPAAATERGKFSATAAVVSPEKSLAERYLTADAPWAAEAKYVVNNGRSVLFFDEFEQIREKDTDGVEKCKAVRLKPFAMVFAAKRDRPEERPVTLVGESAFLRFAGEVDDLATADPGRIVGGNVPGMVQLRGADGLELLGRDFYFSESQEAGPDASGVTSPVIWSDQNVAFRQGPHTGRGRGMRIDLFRIGAPEAFDSVAVNGVKTVTIDNDVEMDLRLDEGGGGPFAALSGDRKERADAPAREPLPTTVTCSGSFEFDLIQNIATFQRDVVATRAVEAGGPPDRLDCDNLAIVFEPATDEGKAARAERIRKMTAGTLTEDDGFQAVDGQLEVKSLMATSNAGRVATLRSPANEFTATFTQLQHEAKTGVTALIRDGGAVDIRQALSRLVSEKVILESVAGGGPPRVSCLGKGWMQHEDEKQPGVVTLQAVWATSLHRLRGPDGLDLIRLTGDADVRQPVEKFRLVADRIDLWLDPKESEKKGEAPAQALSPIASGRMEPVRLVAEKVAGKDASGKDVPGSPVRLRSEELIANADTLDVTFVDPPAAKTTAKLSRAGLMPASSRVRLAAAEQVAPAGAAKSAGEIPASVAPAQAGSVPAQGGAAPARKPPEPIRVVTQAIGVIVERSRPGTAPAAARAGNADRGGQVREVHTTGGVIVSQNRGEGKEPLTIHGDRLDLFNRGKDQELVHVYGKTVAGANGQREERPAVVHDDGSDLWGMNVNLDRRDNLAWVDGKGVIQLPVKNSGGGLLGSSGGDAAKAEPAAESNDEPKEPQKLTVWWRDSMKFDGDKANFFGDVQTQLAGDKMSCEHMEVRLTKRFDFAAAGRPQDADPAERTDPEVAEVLCHDKVLIDGEEKVGERLVGRRKAALGEFRLDRRTGATHAFGPGEILIWRRSEGNRAGLAANNSVRANSGNKPPAGDWEYIKITFNGESNGNVEHQTTTFEETVHVVYGPVLEAGGTIDPNRPDHAPLESGWMMCERLTLTQHKKTESAAAYSEVLAERNVKLDGRDFSGEADQVTYDESKGQYMLRSFGKREATIAKRGTDGKGAGEWPGQLVEFYPATGTAKIHKSSGGSGSLAQ